MFSPCAQKYFETWRIVGEGAGKDGKWTVDNFSVSGFSVKGQKKKEKDGEAAKRCVWFAPNKKALCSVRLRGPFLLTICLFYLILFERDSFRLSEVGRFQEPKTSGKYEPGQVISY